MRAEQRNRHAQQRAGQIAPILLALGRGAVPGRHFRGQPEQLARVRVDRVEIAFFEWVRDILIYAMLAVTALSGLQYVWRSFALLKNSDV